MQMYSRIVDALSECVRHLFNVCDKFCFYFFLIFSFSWFVYSSAPVYSFSPFWIWIAVSKLNCHHCVDFRMYFVLNSENIFGLSFYLTENSNNKKTVRFAQRDRSSDKRRQHRWRGALGNRQATMVWKKKWKKRKKQYAAKFQLSYKK